MNRPNANFERVVIIKRMTTLEELIIRFNTKPQARFYLEQAGEDFSRIESLHTGQETMLTMVRQAIPRQLKQQMIERDLLSQFHFEHSDLIIVVGQDGLVVNTAKYLDGQAILAINPLPDIYDGVLLPFDQQTFAKALEDALAGNRSTRSITFAEARMDDGQSLLGFNDLFIGAASHVSARYRLIHNGEEEFQSSSGIIISTGVGSTGWLKSVYTGAFGVVNALGGQQAFDPDLLRFDWDSPFLVYSVREPFPSKISGTSLLYGVITEEQPLELVSEMSENGVIFSDGVQQDNLSFNIGSKATIRVADKKANMY